MTEAGNDKPLVLITGGQRGLGAALVRSFLAAGCDVIAAGRRGVTQIAGAEVLQLDLESEESIKAAGRALGDRSVDILVHNAAVRGATEGLASVSPGDFLETMRVNVLAPLLLTRTLLPNLRSGDRKLVAMISSRAGSNSEGHVDNSDGDYAYRCSKAALNMATTKLAADFAPEGIAVIALHPGWVKTDMGGDEAPLTVEESADGLKTLILSSNMAQTASFRTHDGRPIGW